MADQTDTLKKGDEAPDFELKGTGGTTFKLGDYRGRKNVVLHFFPQAFSGVCSTQLPAVQKEKSKFEAADAEIVAISVDNVRPLEAFAKQLGVDYPLLADFHAHGAVAQKYGVFMPNAGTTKRAVIVVGKDGRIRHIDVQEPIDIPDEAAALAACSI